MKYQRAAERDPTYWAAQSPSAEWNLRGSQAGPGYTVLQSPAQEFHGLPPAREDRTALHPVITYAPPGPLWTGLYAGAHFGATIGTTDVSDPFGPSIFGDKVPTPGFLAGGQVGYNWRPAHSQQVFGVEANVGWLDSDGTNTCLAFSGFFVSATCRARPNVIGDLTVRAGWAFGPSDRSLLYVKGGTAFVNNRTEIVTNATAILAIPPLVATSSFLSFGWIAGIGLEHAIAPAWSVKLEYDYMGFGSTTVPIPPGLVQLGPPTPAYSPTPAGTARVTQNSQVVRLGLNYRIGVDPWAPWGSALPAFAGKGPVADAAGWEFETGTRYWYSSGTYQKDLGTTIIPAVGSMLNSRLTYTSDAHSAELFGRIETPVNLFVKGNFGAGLLAGGHMNDEDWILFGDSVPYSNTLSDPVKGRIEFANIDLGYDLFRGPGYRFGAFIGFAYYKENKRAYGCVQIANPFSDCVPAISNAALVITEDDTWKSLRRGVSGQVMITDRVKLEGEAAYLSNASFSGTDNHVLRALVSPESGRGRGVQFESVLSYLIDNQFSVGIGGRYWAMWTTADAIAQFGGFACPCQTLPSKSERYGVFLQADYRFAPPPPPAPKVISK